MSRRRRLLPLLSLTWLSVFVFAAPLPAQPGDAAPPLGRAATTAVGQGQSSAAKYWDDLIHYIKIARFDLAAASGRALLDSADDAALLAAVEQGRYSEGDWRSALDRVRDETLAAVSRELTARIQTARLGRSRDSDRIARDIELLAGTLRERQNAIERLRAAGQFAAPQMLQTLLDPRQARLHPHLEAAMVTIGRPLVYPLSVALTEMEPTEVGVVARILGQIGYPFALPFLREVLDRPATDDATRRILQVAHDRLAQAARVPGDVSAAELYLTLGRNYYDAGSLGSLPQGFDELGDRGVVWQYQRGGPLLAVDVSRSIFADVMAMRIARRALSLDSRMDPALSLWLGANLRRENRLLPGESDPLTPPREAMYYARMAGPLRMHDVLDRALDDADTALALDAIAALQATAGTEALINRRGAVQPLLQALTYPDRNVRFNAAFVMTQTRPMESFPGSDSVVFTLAEAVRQSDLRQALAIAHEQEKLNRLISGLQEQGYTVVSGRSLTEVTDTLAIGAPVDVVVADLDLPAVEELHAQMRRNYRLSSAPLVVLASETGRQSLALRFRDDRRVMAVNIDGDGQTLGAAIREALTAAAGDPISGERAGDYASTAVRLLREVALARSPVYNVADAESALIAALTDQRDDIVIGAGQVLELLDTQASQLAIAQAALDQGRESRVREALLNSLAESAKHFGNKLGQIEIDNLLALVTGGEPASELTLAAARAHGALTLPTANAIELIVSGE